MFGKSKFIRYTKFCKAIKYLEKVIVPKCRLQYSFTFLIMGGKD